MLTDNDLNKKSVKQKRRILRKNQTVAEKILWQYLRNKQLKGYKFFRQYSVNKYILDFYCPKLKLAIELDGKQHKQPKQSKHDQIRTQFLQDRGMKVLRFWNEDVFYNLAGVLAKIEEEINI